jgi:arginase
MEFAFAIGRYLEKLPPAFAGRFPAVQPADAVIIGARDTADLAHDRVQSVGPDIRVLADAVVQKSDISRLAKREEEGLMTAGVKGVWLHTDLDVLSTASLPAVDYLQPGGFSWRRLLELSRTVVQNRATLGWDVTIYNPDLDPKQIYASEIVPLIVDAVRA